MFKAYLLNYKRFKFVRLIKIKWNDRKTKL